MLPPRREAGGAAPSSRGRLIGFRLKVPIAVQHVKGGDQSSTTRSIAGRRSSPRHAHECAQGITEALHVFIQCGDSEDRPQVVVRPGGFVIDSVSACDIGRSMLRVRASPMVPPMERPACFSNDLMLNQKYEEGSIC
jgi:hypothetical protein